MASKMIAFDEEAFLARVKEIVERLKYCIVVVAEGIKNAAGDEIGADTSRLDAFGHPVLSGAAVSNIEGSQLDQLIVTNTLPLSPQVQACAKIRQLSVAELLAETIRRIAFGESVSSLYVD